MESIGPLEATIAVKPKSPTVATTLYGGYTIIEGYCCFTHCRDEKKRRLELFDSLESSSSGTGKVPRVINRPFFFLAWGLFFASVRYVRFLSSTPLEARRKLSFPHKEASHFQGHSLEQ